MRAWGTVDEGGAGVDQARAAAADGGVRRGDAEDVVGEAPPAADGLRAGVEARVEHPVRLVGGPRRVRVRALRGRGRASGAHVHAVDDRGDDGQPLLLVVLERTAAGGGTGADVGRACCAARFRDAQLDFHVGCPGLVNC